MRISRNNSRRFIDFKIYHRNYGYETSGQITERETGTEKKTIEIIKQNTNERKNRKNTIPEALFSHREKEIKEEPTQRMERSETRPKKKFTNEKPCKFCNAPN